MLSLLMRVLYKRGAPSFFGRGAEEVYFEKLMNYFFLLGYTILVSIRLFLKTCYYKIIFAI